jgi:hypothetical protein
VERFERTARLLRSPTIDAPIKMAMERRDRLLHPVQLLGCAELTLSLQHRTYHLTGLQMHKKGLLDALNDR